jgi:hypothetical protein
MQHRAEKMSAVLLYCFYASLINITYLHPNYVIVRFNLRQVRTTIILGCNNDSVRFNSFHFINVQT